MLLSQIKKPVNMKFKKIAILTIFISLTSLIGWAEEMSYAAKTFRSNIQTFLREEGFAPTVDNDGSLCFKKEGTAYWIDVIGDKPFYVTFHREPLGTNNAPEISVLKAINDVNTNIRAIKCCFLKDNVSFAIESYCYVAEDFKYVFYSYLGILEASSDLVKEAYSKYDLSSTNSSGYIGNSSGGSSYRSSSSSSTTTSGKISGNTIYINSPILETSAHKWWATSIDLNSYNTVVHKIVVPKSVETWVCATKDEYIEDCDTGRRYYIQSSSIGMEPNKTTLHSKKSKPFTDTFPALPSTVKRINIWSGSDYYAKNLQIR